MFIKIKNEHNYFSFEDFFNEKGYQGGGQAFLAMLQDLHANALTLLQEKKETVFVKKSFAKKKKIIDGFGVLLGRGELLVPCKQGRTRPRSYDYSLFYPSMEICQNSAPVLQTLLDFQSLMLQFNEASPEDSAYATERYRKAHKLRSDGLSLKQAEAQAENEYPLRAMEKVMQGMSSAHLTHRYKPGLIKKFLKFLAKGELEMEQDSLEDKSQAVLAYSEELNGWYSGSRYSGVQNPNKAMMFENATEAKNALHRRGLKNNFLVPVKMEILHTQLIYDGQPQNEKFQAFISSIQSSFLQKMVVPSSPVVTPLKPAKKL